MKVTLFRDLPSEGWFSMERYADELYAALNALGADVNQFVFPRPLPRLRGRIGAWFNHFWRMAIYPLAARAAQTDVNHILDHSYAHLLHTLDPHRTMVTCHDIAPLVLDDIGHGLSRRLWDIAFHAMSRAEHIATDSTYTRAELLRHTSFPAKQISVVPLGVRRPITLPEIPSRTESPTILHVGSCQPRKNLEVLLQALADIPTARLVQVGGQFNTAQLALIQSLNLTARVQGVGRVTESGLYHWYRAATVFVFPSLYEGFGLPVLEAMAAGVPVVCSNATSLPEVAGEAALLFDPHDGATLTAHLRALLGDGALRSSLIQCGQAQSQKFTWERTAQATLALYKKM